jgi:hypoxia up-regulated 1
MYYVGPIQPHSAELMAESRRKLYELAQRDKERMLLEEAKNKVESYIYKMKNKLSDDEETMAKFSTEAEREKIQTLSSAAEDWLYEDGASADQTTLEAKYEELADSLEPILLRIEESIARPKALNELNKKLTDAEALLAQWETSKPQITEEERQSVTTLIERVRQWIEEQETAQSQRQLSEDPAYLSRDIPEQFRPIEALVLRLSRKPKPKPVVTNTTNTTESNFTASATNETVLNETMNETDATGNASATTNETSSSSSSKEEIPVGVEDEL